MIDRSDYAVNMIQWHISLLHDQQICESGDISASSTVDHHDPTRFRPTVYHIHL